MTTYEVTWERYHSLIEELAGKIHHSGWSFEAIVCLARGGLRVGDALDRIFDRPLGVLFTSSYRGDGGRTQTELTIGEYLSSAEPLPGAAWLLVDDLVDSGDTLARCGPELRRRFPLLVSLRTAVLWQKGCSSFSPDYVAEHLPDSPWIVQPFARWDRLTPEDLAGPAKPLP